MPSGDTTTQALTDSLPSVIAQARIVREYKGVMTQLADRVTLGEGVGNTWREFSLAQLSATAFTLTPSVISIHTVITDRTARNISKNVFARTGSLGQNAIERKKDIDGITPPAGATPPLA